jgi:HD-GYP domain-containing protein (c-di-GMP phosphodiesterase class II)
MPCDHSALQSGGARYLRTDSELELVLVCDDCGAERERLGRVAYRLEPRRLVVQVAEMIARELGVSAQQSERVRFAALICGVGRDKLPPEIMSKAGPLSVHEWAEVQRQPELAAALLGDVSMDDIREWVLCYRERPDGTGYPRGLRGDEIPLEARILAVADAYTAMLSDRPHRPRREHHDACAELLRCAGTQFDEDVVGAFLRAASEQESSAARAPTGRDAAAQ